MFDSVLELVVAGMEIASDYARIWQDKNGDGYKISKRGGSLCIPFNGPREAVRAFLEINDPIETLWGKV